MYYYIFGSKKYKLLKISMEWRAIDRSVPTQMKKKITLEGNLCDLIFF